MFVDGRTGPWPHLRHRAVGEAALGMATLAALAVVGWVLLQPDRYAADVLLVSFAGGCLWLATFLLTLPWARDLVSGAALLAVTGGLAAISRTEPAPCLDHPNLTVELAGALVSAWGCYLAWVAIIAVRIVLDDWPPSRLLPSAAMVGVVATALLLLPGQMIVMC